jgi:oligopeptide transport system ATP-binding protein
LLLQVKSINTNFKYRNKTLHAVRDVSFTLQPNERLGIVGESGSGKSVLCLSLMKLLKEPPASISGNALYHSKDLLHTTETTLQSIRGNKISMIFQDPTSSFNPFMKLSDQLIEPLLIHRKHSKKEALEIAIETLALTGVTDPSRRIFHYPHEFSGGMLQRAMIAMALTTNPEILIADEPTTALDVTIQAQILKLLEKISNKCSMSTIFITHNLGIVAHFCNRVLVMYAGVIVESAPTRSIFKSTAHPYTQALLKSVPRLNATNEKLYVIPGSLPDPASTIQGCIYAPRCNFATENCRYQSSFLTNISPDHETSCSRVLNGEISL